MVVQNVGEAPLTRKFRWLKQGITTEIFISKAFERVRTPAGAKNAG
jgi:hypothetical protein